MTVRNPTPAYYDADGRRVEPKKTKEVLEAEMNAKLAAEYPKLLMDTLVRATDQRADIGVVQSIGTEGTVSYRYKVSINDKYDYYTTIHLDATYVPADRKAGRYSTSNDHIEKLMWDINLLEEEQRERVRLDALRQSARAKLNADELSALGLK